MSLADWIARTGDEAFTRTVSDVVVKATAAADAGNGAAVAAAAAMAQELGGLESESREVVFSAPLPPNGLAAMLAAVPAAALDAVVADLAAAKQGAPGDLVPLLRFALDSAGGADAAGMLDAAGLPAKLANAALGMDAAPAYAASAAPAADVSGLAGLLSRTAVPSIVSRTAAALFDGIEVRFGPAIALDAVRAVLLLRLLGPSLPPALDEAVAALLATDPDPAAEAADDALLRWAEQVVAAGQQAEAIAASGEDPDDIVVLRGDALRSAEDLAAAFQAPAPDDPLGSLPAVPLSLLGQALMQARATRPDGYNWAAVAALRRDDEDMFLALVEDERIAVMDLVPIPGGVR